MGPLMSTNPKLAELRAKTDRELVAIIATEIGRALSFARARAPDGSPERAEIAGQYREKAEKAYHSVRKLLPSVDDRRERIRLEAELIKLSELLGGDPDPPDARAFSAGG